MKNIDKIALWGGIAFAALFAGEVIRLMLPYYSFYKVVYIAIALCFIYISVRHKDLGKSIPSINFSFINVWKKILWYIRDHKDDIICKIWLWSHIGILLSLLFNTTWIMAFCFWLLVVCVFVFAFIGGRFEAVIEKYSGQTKVLYAFVWSYIVFFVFIWLMLHSFWIEQWVKNIITFWFSVLFVSSGYVLFFYEKRKRIYRRNLKKELLTPYNIWMLAIIAVLWVVVWSQFLTPQKSETQYVLDGEVMTQEDLRDTTIDTDALIEEKTNQDEIIYKEVSVFEVFDLPFQRKWDSWTGVESLQKVLRILQTYTWDITWDFDEDTRLALRDALIEWCEWPASTSGIFGPLAKDCVDNLIISVPDESWQE